MKNKNFYKSKLQIPKKTDAKHGPTSDRDD